MVTPTPSSVLEMFWILALFLSSEPLAELEPALRGFDPVALCQGEELPGREDLTARHGRHVYRFATPEARARFLADPERWGIQWGGACARMGPLSGRGAPDRWAVEDGRIWVFASEDCRAAFLTAPERFTESPAAFGDDPQAAAEGRTWLGRVVEAHGGAAAIDARRALVFSAVGEASGWKSERELVVSATGDVRRTSVWLPPEDSDASVIETVWVVADDAFTREDDELFELTSTAERVDVLRYAHRQLLPLLWARDEPGFVAMSRGPGMLDGRVTADLWIGWQGLSTVLHIDPDTSRILGLSWRGRVVDGAARDVREVFTDSKTIDGIVLPVARKVLVDGEEKASFTWNETALLTEPPAAAFERPGEAH